MGVKRPGREFDHSLSCSTEVKNEWSWSLIPLFSVNGVDVDIFAFLNIFGFQYWSSLCNSSTEFVFLGAFEKLREATVSFVMSVCPSVCPDGINRLPLDGFA